MPLLNKAINILDYGETILTTRMKKTNNFRNFSKIFSLHENVVIYMYTRVYVRTICISLHIIARVQIQLLDCKNYIIIIFDGIAR